MPADLEGLDALIIPGGESTVMTLGIEREGLARATCASWSGAGTPVLGTCAGMIMLDRDHLGVLDIHAQRNAFGRQLRSFESEVDVRGVEGGPLRAVFIRAPWVDEHGEGVEVLAEIDGHPVAVRQGNVLAVAFHPELAGDGRLHETAARARWPQLAPSRRRARLALALAVLRGTARSKCAQSNVGSAVRVPAGAARRPAPRRPGGSSESVPRDSHAASAQTAIPAA